MTKHILLILIIGVTFNMTFSASRASDSAFDPIAERINGFKASKRAVSIIKDALETGNMDPVVEQAAFMANFAERIPSLFPPGSKGGFFSGAKDSIWKNFSDYLEKNKKFQESAKNLADLAAEPSPDRALVADAFRRVTGDCKNCHRFYKRGR